jgi:predicted chitinase
MTNITSADIATTAANFAAKVTPEQQAAFLANVMDEAMMDSFEDMIDESMSEELSIIFCAIDNVEKAQKDAAAWSSIVESYYIPQAEYAQSIGFGTPICAA